MATKTFAEFVASQQPGPEEVAIDWLAERDRYLHQIEGTLLSGSKGRVDAAGPTARCRERSKDDLSTHFRRIKRYRGTRVRLDEDILGGWKAHGVGSSNLVAQLRAPSSCGTG